MYDCTAALTVSENGIDVYRKKSSGGNDTWKVTPPVLRGRPRQKLDPAYVIDGKPFLMKEQVIRLVEDKFGLEVINVKAMNSYEGQNFLVEASPTAVPEERNGNIPNTKYFLKISNSLLSSWQESFIDSFLLMLDFLRESGISCPVPIPDKEGSLWDMITFTNLSIGDGAGSNTNKSREDVFMVRLFTYLPGVSLDNVSDIPLYFYGEMGSTLAQIHKTLKKYNISRKLFEMWGMTLPYSLNCVGQMKDILHVVKDPMRSQMILEVMDEYDQHVLQLRENLPKGFVHGDFSEVNVLFSANQDQEMHLTGVIDFDHFSYNCLVYDVGTSVMYILQSKTPYKDEAAALFLSEYNKRRKLTDLEKSCLFYCVVARCVQSLLIGLYAHEKIRDKYIIATQERGWPALEDLWKDGKELTYRKWGLSEQLN